MIDLLVRVVGMLFLVLGFVGFAFGWHWTRCMAEDLYAQLKAKAKKKR